MRKVRQQTELRCERSKLREFIERVFVPALERGGASKSHLERHVSAVEYFERFRKEPPSPDFDEEEILNFDAWLWRQGISDGRRRDLVESLRRIRAAYVPDKLRCRTNRRNRRILPPPIEGSLRHCYETLYVPIRLVGRTARYIDENRAALWRMYEHYGRDLLPAECTSQLISDHVGWLLDLGLRPSTINTGHLAVILAILRFAYERGLVHQLPSVRKLPVDENEPDAWSPEQVAAFIEATPFATDKRIAGIDAGDWWEALVRIVWYTGLRRRTVLAIRHTPPDVDLTTGWLRVPGSAMKTHKGKQFRLGVDALEAIARIWEPRRELLLPFPFDKGTFYDQFHRIREAAGLSPSSSHMGCLHLLRRSTATEAARNHGIGAAQTIMGHSSPAITRRYLDRSKLPGQDFTEVLRPLPRREKVPRTLRA